MTDYKQIAAERTAANIQLIIEATQSPATFNDIVAATGINISGVRTLMLRNMEYFKFLGKIKREGSNVQNLYQAEASPMPTGQQVIYHNPYSQLTGDPDYIDKQDGVKIPFSTTNNLRASQKSAFTFVSGSTLS